MMMNTAGRMKSAIGSSISEGARCALHSAMENRSFRISSLWISIVSASDAPSSVPNTTAEVNDVNS